MRRVLVLLMLLPGLLFAGDITTLYDELALRHPDFFNTVPEDEADALVASLEAESGAYGKVEYWYALEKVAAIAHDSHTQVALDAQVLTSMHFLPIGFDLFDEGLAIVWAGEGYEELLGQIVDTICGLDLDGLLALAGAWISHDNEVHLTQSLLDNHLVFHEFYETLSLVEEGEDITIALSDGRLVDIPALSFDEWAVMERKILQEAIPPTLNPADPYSAMLLDDPEALLVNYHSCVDWPAMPMADFALRVEELVRQEGFTKVIIDLRYNAGGDSSVIDPLVDALERIQDERGLEVYVLIGEDSFSSAILNALTLCDRLGAILVGRPTGGSVSHFGELQSFALPDTDLTCWYSTKWFDNGEKGPLMPDIYTPRHIEDYRTGRDGALVQLGVVQ